MTRKPVVSARPAATGRTRKVVAPPAVAAVLGHTVLPTGITTPDGRFTWVNDALCRLLGRSRAALMHSTWAEITYPDDIASDARQVRRLVTGRSGSYRMRKRYELPDGSIRWGDLTVTAIQDSTGATTQLLGQVVDITDAVAVEEMNKTAIQRLKQALDAQVSPELIFESIRDGSGSLVDLRIIEANQAAAGRLQRPREGLIGVGILDIFGGRPDPELWGRLQGVIATGADLDLPLFRTMNFVANEERVFELRATKVDDGLALAWRDITDLYRRTDEELRRSSEQYRLVLENSADVIFHTIEGIVQWISPSCTQVLGSAPEEFIGRPTVQYWHPDDREAAIALRDSTYAGKPALGTLRWRRPDGSYLWVQASLRPVTEPDGRSGAVGMVRDVSEQVLAQQALADSEQRYRILAENIADVVGTGTADGRIDWISDSVGPLLGWTPAQLHDRAFIDLVHPQDQSAVLDASHQMQAGKPAAYDARVATATGGYRWLRIRTRPTIDPQGTVTGLVSGWQDIHDRVEAMNRLDEVLGTDSLTGLPNRMTIERRIDALHAQAEARGCAGAVLCVGVDRLGDVNSAIDHAAGDLVLTTLARRIAESVPDPQLVGRGAGADFLVLLPTLTSVSDSVAVAERIRDEVKKEIVVDHRRIRVTASIGIASCREEASAEELIRSATLAMKAAKEQGRDRLAFDDPSLHEQADRLLTLAEHARDSLAEDRFRAWYMPIMDLETQECVGYESLVRWDFPGGTILEPKEFLGALIQARIIGEVDRAVLRQALAQLATLPDPVFMSVNVSPQALAVPDYADEVIALVHAAAVDPARLHLEVTETSLFGVSGTNVATMQRIWDAGIKWYVDDFGTGYSSISHLHDLPIDGLKLDTSFAQGLIAGNRRSLRLTQALAGLSMGLGLDTIAEGVCDRAQATILWGQGWRRGQGWLYGKAAPTATPDQAQAAERSITPGSEPVPGRQGRG